MDTILAVDTDIAVHEQQTQEWKKYNVDTVRVDTITEAIRLITLNENYLFIAINEDTIPGYLDQLPMLRIITQSPIFIVTNTYTTEKRLRAMQAGADVYESFEKHVKGDVLTALELLKAQEKSNNRSCDKKSIILTGDVVISLSQGKVFASNTEVKLTKKEFDIFCYFVNNKGLLLTYNQIFNGVWGFECDKSTPDTINAHLKRLRKKFAEISSGYDRMIENVHGVGYRFTLSSIA